MKRLNNWRLCKHLVLQRTSEYDPLSRAFKSYEKRLGLCLDDLLRIADGGNAVEVLGDKVNAKLIHRANLMRHHIQTLRLEEKKRLNSLKKREYQRRAGREKWRISKRKIHTKNDQSWQEGLRNIIKRLKIEDIRPPHFKVSGCRDQGNKNLVMLGVKFRQSRSENYCGFGVLWLEKVALAQYLNFREFEKILQSFLSEFYHQNKRYTTAIRRRQAYERYKGPFIGNESYSAMNRKHRKAAFALRFRLENEQLRAKESYSNESRNDFEEDFILNW